MPSSILGSHASAPVQQQDEPRKMTAAPATPKRRIVPDPVVSPTDDEANVPRRNKARLEGHKKSGDYMLRSGFAGGIAGCVAKTAVGPLDRVKILFQASNPQFAKYTGSWAGVMTAFKDIYQQDGIRGLYRGHSATLLRIFPYAGIKFLAYEQFRARIIKKKSQETPLRRTIAGSLAGCTCVLLTYPLEVIRVRLAFETRRDARPTLSSICRKIYNERPPIAATTSTHLDTSSLSRVAASTINATTATVQQVAPRYGITNFFRGFTPTLWGMVPYAGLSFLVHDTMGDILRYPSFSKYTVLEKTEGKSRDPHKPAQLTYWAEYMAGSAAGFVAQTASYPLEVVRRRMQVGGVVGDGHRLSMAEVARRIWLERGWRGFYVGLGIGYVKTVPMVATSFLVYERMKYWLGI